MSSCRRPASSPSEAGRDEEEPQGVEAVVADVLDEREQLLGVPYAWPIPDGTWRIGPIGGIAGQVVPPDGVPKGLVQNPVHVDDGLGREPARAVDPVAGEQVTVEKVQPDWGQVAETGGDLGEDSPARQYDMRGGQTHLRVCRSRWMRVCCPGPRQDGSHRCSTHSGRGRP